MILMSQKLIQAVAVIAIIVFSVAQCQENEKRAVAEHQFMNDRGRTVQSLKRLMWLSNTINGLHTAQTRAPPLDSDPPDCWTGETQQFLSQLESGLKRGTLGSLLRMLWCADDKPRFSRLPENDK